MFLANGAGGGLFGLDPLIILFPVVGLFTNILFGRRRGERFVGLVASLAVALSFGVAVTQLIALLGQPEGARVIVADWIAIGSLSVPWAIQVDSLSVTMMLMVSGVSTLIHIYATGYMHADVRLQGDPARYTRFFVYFNLFVAAMMVLVTGDSFLTLFVGWEGVGLCSYLLIGFWYEKGAGGIGNAVAGKKAFITNRIGDFGFLVAMFLAYWAFGSLQFEEVFQRAEEMGPGGAGVLTAITLFLLLGATGKSAQIPLYVWLPDAMAGPTPVSALIHAATMVTAGVYMVARLNFLFSMSPVAMTVVALTGAATALFAATIGFFQYDIKKVLAYSTVSQLGFMFVGVGIGAYWVGIFHLVTHAFFKACLFLGSGAVIHGMHHVLHGEAAVQDMRNMGGLGKFMPWTRRTYFVACLAITAAPIPGLAGFWSKDEILFRALTAEGLLVPGLLVYAMLAIAAGCTSFYMWRSYFLTFEGEPRAEIREKIHDDGPKTMWWVLVALAGLS